MSTIDLKKRKVKSYRHDPQNRKSLLGDNVRALHIDYKGNIWVGTNQGLALFNPQTDEFIGYKHHFDHPNSLAGDNAHHIMESKEHSLWIFSDMGGQFAATR